MSGEACTRSLLAKMNRPVRSIPFNITILALMALIVVPLASTLLWLGWRAVGSLEERSADQKMTALHTAVSTFMADGVRLIVSVGLTLVAQPSFAAPADRAADEERLRQLVGLLNRHPYMSAAYVGYDDGRFLYAGRVSLLSPAQRNEFAAAQSNAIIERIIEEGAAMRREVWRFVMPDGSMTPGREHTTSFDPRERPWYAEAVRTHAPTLTQPYHFASSNEPGISVGLPLRVGGALGLDFTLGTLSRLLAEYKITPNSIVMLSTGVSEVLIESEPCKVPAGICFSNDGEVRKALREVLGARNSPSASVNLESGIGGRLYRIIVRPVPAVLGKSFSVAAAVPKEELTAESRGLIEHSAVLAAGAVIVAALAVFGVSLVLSRALLRITAKTESIRRLDFSDTAPIKSRISEISQLSNAIERMREGLQVFGRYVSKDLVSEIMRAPANTGLGGTRRQLTVLFTDIEGFSRISESIEPELLMSRLSRYYEMLGAAISANHGMIDKYIGDSIMAFWNAPQPDPDHIANACRAALQAAAASRTLAEKWRQLDRPVFRTRIGIHTGLAVVGNVGARERINYTLVGTVANQASRLEGLNKVYGTEILASSEIALATTQQFVWRHIDRIVAAGTTEVLEIYEPLGEITHAAECSEFLTQWQTGHEAYVEGRFGAAIVCFRAALALRPDDGPSRTFIDRCSAFVRKGQPKDWDGAWHFDKK